VNGMRQGKIALGLLWHWGPSLALLRVGNKRYREINLWVSSISNLFCL
jgi:hypothetical protein